LILWLLLSACRYVSHLAAASSAARAVDRCCLCVLLLLVLVRMLLVRMLLVRLLLVRLLMRLLVLVLVLVSTPSGLPS
jgi:hypothetical protein